MRYVGVDGTFKSSQVEEDAMRYFEVDFGEESMCIRGVDEPTLEEARFFCETDSERYGTVIGICEIDFDEVERSYDTENIEDWPVFRRENEKRLVQGTFNVEETRALLEQGLNDGTVKLSMAEELPNSYDDEGIVAVIGNTYFHFPLPYGEEHDSVASLLALRSHAALADRITWGFELLDASEKRYCLRRLMERPTRKALGEERTQNIENSCEKHYVPEIKHEWFFDTSDMCVEVSGYLPACMNGGTDGFEFLVHDGNNEIARVHAIGEEEPFVVAKGEASYPPCPKFLDRESVVMHYDIDRQIQEAVLAAQMHLMEEKGFSEHCWIDLVASGVEDAPSGTQKCAFEIEGRDFSNDAPTWRANVTYGDGKTANIALYPEECIPSFMRHDGCPFDEADYGKPRVWHPKGDIYLSKQQEPLRVALQSPVPASQQDVMRIYQELSRKLLERGTSQKNIPPRLLPPLAREQPSQTDAR